jgi:hypothetical protein
MSSLRISTAAARRIDRIARKGKRQPQQVLDSALKAGLDYQEWFQAEVAKGLAVLKDLARQKAAVGRALKKALSAGNGHQTR